MFFCALTRSSFFCVMFACICFFCFFFLICGHWLAQSSCGGLLENAQCFGERVLLRPPFLFRRSHFPEKHLPGLTGLPELPDGQWGPQEVRGGAQTAPPPLLRSKCYDTEGVGGRDKLVLAGMAVLADMLSVQTF